MRPSLWFVVPAHGRAQLAAICLRQLRRTCDALTAEGIDASAVVVADDENLDTAKQLGFATVRRDNTYLSRKFNDGIQFALDQRFNPRPADYIVPCGSDDWIDYRILLNLPPRDTVLGFQMMSFVREDGREITAAHVGYKGGCGMRVYPRQLLALTGYRPADEDRARACDTSILTNVQRAYKQATRRDLTVIHGDVHDRQIVDWKTGGEQINTYADVGMWKRSAAPDPFAELAGTFPAESLREMQHHYARAGRALVAA